MGNSSFLKDEFDSKRQNNYGKNSIISTNSNCDSSNTRRKIYDKTRKKKANELIDDYDYNTQDSNKKNEISINE